VSISLVWAAVLASSEDPYVSLLFFSLTLHYFLFFLAGRPCTMYWPKVFFHDDPLIEMLGSMIPIDSS
jgi:hypothetical protein